MAGVVWYLFSAAGAIVCTAIGVLWLLVARTSPWPRRWLVAVVVTFWIASTAAVPAGVGRLLAWGFAPLTREMVPPGRTAVVLLGSGSYRLQDWGSGEFLVVDRIGASRLVEAARVFHLLNADYVISSGGRLVVSDRTSDSGSSMADALVTLGVPPERIVVEDKSGTTRHEAVLIKDILAARPVDHVVLVTSHIHMRRSAGAFRAVGIPVIPAIDREPPSFDVWWEMAIPTDKGLEDSGLVAHELAGLVQYRASGWYK